MADTTQITPVSKDHPIIKKRIEKSLKLSVSEGGFSSVYKSLNTTYITPFALAMQATAAQVGILGAFAMLLPSVSQLGSVKLIEKYSRKKILILGGILTSLILIPIMLTAYLYMNNVPHVTWILIALVGIMHVSLGVIYPAWFSLMGSLVSPEKRGTYFSKRNRVSQFFGVLAMVVAALFLDYMKDIGSLHGEIVAFTFYGFFAIFTLSMICRTISIFLISRHYEPKLLIKKKDHYTLVEFVKQAKENPFGRFAIYNGFFRIAVGIASPFFAVFLLTELGYSYTWFMIIMTSSFIFQVYFLKLFGKMSDKFGNILLTKLATGFIALTPLVWAISFFIPATFIQKLYLIFFAQVINGFGWGGFNLSMANYVYDATQEKRQGYALAYLNLFNGIGYFIGAIFGSFIVKTDYLAINIIVAVLLLSFIARALTVLIGSRYLTEVRNVDNFSPEYMLQEIHPIRETINEFHHLNHLGAKVIHHI